MVGKLTDTMLVYPAAVSNTKQQDSLMLIQT